MKVEWNKVTWYSKCLALALFIALPLIGFYLGIRYGEARQYTTDTFANLENASSSATAFAGINAYYKNVSEWQTYQDNAGWSIAYPIDFNVENFYLPTPVDNWRAGTSGGPGLQLFKLTIPKALEPQTNFNEAVLSVGMSSNKKAITQCLIAETTDGRTSTSTMMINDTVFTIFHFADVGLGNYYETTSYRTLHAGQCYAVEYTIHSSQIMNYPLEYHLKPFNEMKLRDVLDRIVGTFRFK